MQGGMAREGFLVPQGEVLIGMSSCTHPFMHSLIPFCHVQYTKQKKPTGEGKHPSNVWCAHEIKDLINDKASTRDIGDNSELEDDDSSNSDMPKVAEPVCSTIARHAASPPLRQPCTSAANAVNTLVHSLDLATL
jgi:hypothetical protein